MGTVTIVAHHRTNERKARMQKSAQRIWDNSKRLADLETRSTLDKGSAIPDRPLVARSAIRKGPQTLAAPF
jgi:hypothetical protein